jgi:hypothetical protein
VNTPDKAKFDAIMKFDPLATAEEIGKNVPLSAVGIQDLGMLLHMGRVQEKRAYLSALGDTHFGSSYSEVCKIIESCPDFEFECVFKQEFTATDHYSKEKKKRQEEERMYWSKKYGIVIYIESYLGSSNTVSVNFELQCEISGDLSFEDQERRKSELHVCAEGTSGGIHNALDREMLHRSWDTKTPLPTSMWYRDCHLDGREGLISRLSFIAKHEFITFNPKWKMREHGHFPCMFKMVNHEESHCDDDDKSISHYRAACKKAEKEKIQKVTPEFAAFLKEYVLEQKEEAVDTSAAGMDATD